MYNVTLMNKQSQLKILEAYTRDVGKGVVRIDYNIMDKLDCSTGDIIILKNKKKEIVAKALPLYPSDEDKGLCRTDGVTRTTLGVDINDSVTVTKTDAKMCTNMTVKPLQHIPFINESYISNALVGNPVKIGMIVMVYYFGTKLKFEISKIDPTGHVLIVPGTCITIEKPQVQEIPDTRSKAQQEEFPLRKILSWKCKCGHMMEKHGLSIDFADFHEKCKICVCNGFISIDK